MIGELIESIREIEKELNESKAIQALHSDITFQRAILNDYCKQHLEHLVTTRIDLTEPNQIAQREKEIDAVVYFKRYLTQSSERVTQLEWQLRDAQNQLTQLQSRE